MKNRLLWVFLFFTITLMLFLSSQAHAGSSYVLPYPSSMPGSIFYKVNLIKDKILEYWYFGNFGQFEYNQKLSDKYLVEAKTLFEYSQYLLACSALKKSNEYFENIYPNLIQAKKENKNISRKQQLFKEEALKHIEELIKLEKEVPNSFYWQPEKTSPTILNLKQLIQESINIRKTYL